MLKEYLEYEKFYQNFTLVSLLGFEDGGMLWGKGRINKSSLTYLTEWEFYACNNPEQISKDEIDMHLDYIKVLTCVTCFLSRRD